MISNGGAIKTPPTSAYFHDAAVPLLSKALHFGPIPRSSRADFLACFSGKKHFL